jgi:glutamate carboxypeptidase
MTVMSRLTAPSDVLEVVASHQGWLKRQLQLLVEIESPSDAPAAVNRANDFVSTLAKEIGGRGRRHKQKQFGDILELRFGPRTKRKPVLLLGHLDTVWPIGTLQSMPWRETGGRLWGPGVLDMKAGVLMALTAIKSLQQLKLAPPVTLLLNSDEEVGSTVSRRITERFALASSAVFVLEPAQGLAYKTARKGVGQYNLHVIGVAAHSGVDFARGHSAIREMARLVETVSNFTDLSRGRTVNCGVIRGGTRSNVIAEHAFAEVDARIAKSSDASKVDRLFRELKVTDLACRLDVSGGINRPPMERTPATIALFKEARRLASELGFVLDEASTGGGSDGNFTSALGVPTLDGMGAVGEGAHAAHESVLIEHLLPRTALLAAMIASASAKTLADRQF